VDDILKQAKTLSPEERRNLIDSLEEGLADEQASSPASAPRAGLDRWLSRAGTGHSGLGSRRRQRRSELRLIGVVVEGCTMKRNLMTRPWASIRETYARFASYKPPGPYAPLVGPMLQLAEAIEHSRYAQQLHAWTSHLDLCIIQVPSECPYDGPQLRISPTADGTLLFQYGPDVGPVPADWAAARRDRTVEGRERRDELEKTLTQQGWRLECDWSEGFATFEKCLDRMGWVGTEGAQQGRGRTATQRS